MSAAPASTNVSRTPPDKKSRIGLVVFGSITLGLVLGLVLVLIVFPGGDEAQITGAALLALGAGFMLLAVASSRFTDQPQRWALAPGVASAVVGLAVLLFSPGNRALGLAGWVWPVLLLVLVGWSFWGARRSLDNWSRRALLYPALFVLLLVAVGGAYETVAEATSSNPAPAGRTHLVNSHRLYLNCVGAGSPTVVLFNGLGERTPSWAWVQRAPHRRRGSARSIAQGKDGAAQRQVARTATSWPPTLTVCSRLRTSPGGTCWPGTPPAAPTRSCTPRSTRSKSRGSPWSTRPRRISSISRTIRRSTRCGDAPRRCCHRLLAPDLDGSCSIRATRRYLQTLVTSYERSPRNLGS